MSLTSYTQPAAYQALPGGPLDPDRRLYDRIRSAQRSVTQEFEVPIRSAEAWVVPAGSAMRIYSIDGPQVGDLNLWNWHNPRERFWAARTRQLQQSSMTTYDRMWSTLPALRPMATVLTDTLAEHPDAAAIHDLLGTRCDPYVNRMLSGEDFDYHCHSNLTRAIQPYGLTEYDVHDVLNVFQFAGLNEYGQYFMDTCPARPAADRAAVQRGEFGDYIEFFAEIDLLVALSACPGGDLSVPLWGPEAASLEEQLEHCHPLGVQIYRVDEAALDGWEPPQTAQYRGANGLHGLSATAYGHR